MPLTLEEAAKLGNAVQSKLDVGLKAIDAVDWLKQFGKPEHITVVATFAQSVKGHRRALMYIDDVFRGLLPGIIKQAEANARADMEELAKFK